MKKSIFVLALMALGVAAPAAATTFIAQWMGAPGAVGASTAGLRPGLHVSVLEGAITVSNSGGVQIFTAGQFGYTGSNVTPPVMVPNNPGLKFTPPPVFSSATLSGGPSSTSAKPDTVDCEVR